MAALEAALIGGSGHVPKQVEQQRGQAKRKGKKTTNMRLVGEEQLLPVPSPNLAAAKAKPNLRNIFAHCMATMATNQAARDYRRWFCR